MDCAGVSNIEIVIPPRHNRKRSHAQQRRSPILLNFDHDAANESIFDSNHL